MDAASPGLQKRSAVRSTSNRTADALWNPPVDRNRYPFTLDSTESITPAISCDAVPAV